MKTILTLCFLISIFTISNAQDFDCELISIDEIKDTIDLDGNPVAKITLSTISNPNCTGYTSFLLLNNNGDTLIDYSINPDYHLPCLPGNLVETYSLKFVPPFTSIGNNFNGKLITGFFPICEFSIDNTTSLNENIDLPESSISISPNPSINSFTIRSNKIIDTTFEVFNLAGIKMLERNINGKEFQIETINWAKGMYWLRIKEKLIKLVKI